MEALDKLDRAARRRGCTMGVRIVSFREAERQSVLGTLEVRTADGRPRFRDRELVAAERLIGGGGFERSLEQAAETILRMLKISLPED